MFISTLKINKNFLIKLSVCLISFLFVFLLILLFIKLRNNSNESIKSNISNTSSKLNTSNILKIDTENYTTFLNDCHENIANYIDKKISISGYVYRMNDFKDNQFVVARTMLINDSKNSVVVGILCDYDKAINYADYDWIELTGTIKEGYYNGKLHCINVEKINKIKPPENSYVKEPID